MANTKRARQRDVLEVPLAEILRHLQTSERQDVKIVAPSILTEKLYKFLTEEKGKKLKREIPLRGNLWSRSYTTKPNKLCESADFSFSAGAPLKGPFAISFANERANQEEHYHKRHTEIYFSEHRIGGYYKKLRTQKEHPITLAKGGLILFGPYVVHYMELDGLTLVVEVPAVEDDRFP